MRAAAARLRAGPAHTFELAADVLGLAGHRGAAAAAVFQLLGADPRFTVDGEGVWTLAPDALPEGRPLAEVGFAVVDVETTGGRAAAGHRVVEIAVVEVREGSVADAYHTLVDPGVGVPAGITALTGITGAMVAGAPPFEGIAEEVRSRLEGRAFVAHNAAFDWGFVEGELVRALGEAPDVPRLCTVRMARRLVPGLRRRNLDALARHFGVDVHERHRAYGDALATARILLRLLDEARGRGIDDLEALTWYVDRRGGRRGRPRADPGQLRLGLEASGG